MCEQYIRWLLGFYQEATGKQPASVDDEVTNGVAIVAHHSRRRPGEDDFVSLVALEVIDRITKAEVKDTLPPFRVLLNLSAGAVRARLTRAAEKRLTERGGDAANWITAPDSAGVKDSEELVRQLAEQLTLEEHMVLRMLLAGREVANIANKFGVSQQTMYRRVQEIRRRLSSK